MFFTKYQQPYRNRITWAGRKGEMKNSCKISGYYEQENKSQDSIRGEKFLEKLGEYVLNKKPAVF